MACGAPCGDIQDDAIGRMVTRRELYPGLIPPNMHAVDSYHPAPWPHADALMVKVCEEVVGPRLTRVRNA